MIRLHILAHCPERSAGTYMDSVELVAVQLDVKPNEVGILAHNVLNHVLDGKVL